MFKKLKNKFIILNMTMISIVMICAFISIYVITLNNIDEQNKLMLEKESSSALRYFASKESDNENNYKEITVGIVPSDYYVQSFSVLLNKDGNPMFNSGASELFKEYTIKFIDVALKESVNTKKIEIDANQYEFHIVNMYAKVNTTVETNDLNAEMLQVISFLDITNSQNTLKQLLITFIVIGAIMLFIIFLISIYFAKCAVYPIESSYLKQKQFIEDASHELKTPLASISANMDALQWNPNETVRSQQKWINYINLEIERMSKLIGDLLYLAKNENTENIIDSTTINFSDIINHSLLTMEAVVYEKGLQLNEAIEEDIIINGELEKIQQVIKILLDNAIKYINQGGIIDISLKQRKNQAIFTITNTGEGIGSEHIDKIFNRFYRIDPSREHDGGYGLGLSIAKSIIDNMHGDISVKSVQGEYTTFTVILNK